MAEVKMMLGLLAAFLWAQLKHLDRVQARCKTVWSKCCEALKTLAGSGKFTLPVLPDYATNNAHMFYLLFPDLATRTDFIARMKAQGVLCVFHYLALHSSDFYRMNHDNRALPNCDRFADCLVRLPMYYELADNDLNVIADCVETCT